MIEMQPIGYVRSTRKKNFDDHWDQETIHIELDQKEFSHLSLKGLEQFSHAIIIFFMHDIQKNKIETEARHPRNNSFWPEVGIFAQGAKNRPNQIGVTVCKILKVDGHKLHVMGLDAIDGTPVLDIKPWAEEFGPRGKTQQPGWISELMKEYWKS